VDSCGNVVGQVASIAEAGETSADDEDQTTSPSVPIRFCTAAEEILRLSSPSLANEYHGQARRSHEKAQAKGALSQGAFPLRSNLRIFP
jgi:hypothetical protein